MLGTWVGALSLIAIAAIGYAVWGSRRRYYATIYLFFVRYPILLGVVLLLFPIAGPLLFPQSLPNLFVLDRSGVFVTTFYACISAWSTAYVFLLIWVSTPIRSKLGFAKPPRTAKKVSEVQAAAASEASDDSGYTDGFFGAARVLGGVVVWLLFPIRWLLDKLSAPLLRWLQQFSTGEKVRNVEGFWTWAFRALARGEPPARDNDKPLALLSHARAFAALLLLAPLFVVMVLRGDESTGISIASIAAGVVAAFLFRAVGSGALGPWSGALGRKFSTWFVEHVQAREDRLPYRAYEYHDTDLDGNRLDSNLDADSWLRLHARAALFALAAALAHAILGMVGGLYLEIAVAPAIAYLASGFIILPWVFGNVSFQFDTPRVPVLLWIVLAVLAGQAVAPSNYRFEVADWPAYAPPQHAVSVLEDEWGGPERDVLVVVAASGGGISAAVWTARVLQGLEEELDDDAAFRERLGVISAVSGGAVGAMHYMDARMRLLQAPGSGVSSPSDSAVLRQAVRDAGASSLDASVWGLVYPDLVRLNPIPFLRLDMDRGRAIERRWAARLAGTDVRLSHWHDPAPRRYPIVLFNATLQETGERLVLSPLVIGNSAQKRRRGFLSTYCEPGPHDPSCSPRDLKVVTAARASATFPYVSPQAKMDVGGDLEPYAYHTVDGGYFDNSGVLSAVELLDEWLDQSGFQGRIALVEVVAGPAGGELSNEEPKSSNLLNSWVGPFQTLFEVRAASQLARISESVRVYAENWAADSVEFRPFTFSLSENLPLSWHLSQEEHEEILSHWPSERDLLFRGAESPQDSANVRAALPGFTANRNAAELAALRRFLTGF